MPRPRTSIAPQLRGHAVRSADAAEWGVSRSRLRREDVTHPYRGVVGFDLMDATIRERCLGHEPALLPGQAFSHTTALALLGMPLPAWCENEPLHLSVVFPRTPPRGIGVRGHSLRRLGVTQRFGLPLAEPEYAWAQSASMLTREDLTAVGDALLTGQRANGVRGAGMTTTTRLGEVAALLVGSPGSAKVAWALSRLRTGVDSRPETLLRLVCVRGKLPEPVTDHPIRIADGLVLHADLAFVRARIALEYEGDVHRVDRATWVRDLRRRELLEDAGWRVVRVTAADLFGDPEGLVARIRALLAARDHRANT